MGREGDGDDGHNAVHRPRSGRREKRRRLKKKGRGDAHTIESTEMLCDPKCSSNSMHCSSFKGRITFTRIKGGGEKREEGFLGSIVLVVVVVVVSLPFVHSYRGGVLVHNSRVRRPTGKTIPEKMIIIIDR